MGKEATYQCTHLSNDAVHLYNKMTSCNLDVHDSNEGNEEFVLSSPPRDLQIATKILKDECAMIK